MYSPAVSTNSVQAFGLPEGRTLQSYFTNVDPAGLAMLVAGLVIILLAYLIFVKKDGNFSQAIGYIVIIFATVWFLGDGLPAVKEILLGLINVAWDWITS